MKEKEEKTPEDMTFEKLKYPPQKSLFQLNWDLNWDEVKASLLEGLSKNKPVVDKILENQKESIIKQNDSK